MTDTATPTPGTALFRTVLIANRGEIARRVIRTLRALGIRSVAVYSDADADAPHVREADEAVRIGPAAATQSYLDIDAVIRAARSRGAEAIHPGYGFLSENPALGRACAEAGLVFIGPGERALEVMADKIRAREHVAAHGVPVVPGFSAAGLDDDEIAVKAAEAGFPLLVKPSAGGGGKGMQVVRDAAELVDALATARRVAAASFGDDTLLLERLIERPRHIEVQVLGDAHGTVVHLGERECTLQRRHQKVIEEAPSPIVDAVLRDRLGAAAVAAAESVDYQGAGTIEFLVSAERPDEFFFIEMNTRLQVEHPVTELVTGVDLVEQQVRIAAGLPLELGEVRMHGHAIEARVYAETPAQGFLPATGDVLLWAPSAAVRVDSAIETGSVVGADYDPMIAKIIAFADDRDAALERLDAALAETTLFGVESNIAYLRDLLADPDVVAGRLDTGLIDRRGSFVEPDPSDAALGAAAAAAHAAQGDSRAADHGASPVWRALEGWRLGLDPEPAEVLFSVADGVEHVRVAEPDRSTHACAGPDGRVWVHAEGRTSVLQPLTRRAAAERLRAGRERAAGHLDPALRAPMPGAVIAVHVADGDEVHAGDRILSVEAMKMEHPVLATHDGVVRLRVVVGDQVRRDQIVARIDDESQKET
ncbi:acetyl-CoA carboxylase biotin carboxylase subunit [Microbacterium pseudoresistens]|uniref:biotin carboxylase n=1 Tax=Microbacterium pseudoresistens TaxID=640634 RepID=A0A7Y9JNR7_9MICO|nr:biotin carboxylase N-terminal domain-containing protein [Microbacterium pseudoresistens]NYD55401.1 acetyl-CoA/propionyl-CoA carboxylase biotin carboxyl carrier protein [Microbacterium pseudoresistens]